MIRSKRDPQQMIAALLRERDSYEKAGRDEDVKLVDEQLKLYGYSKSPDTVEAARKQVPQGRSERPTLNVAKKEGQK